MRLTSKGRYAVRAILDLTFNSNGRPVRLQEISERQKISLHYLEQLFRRLRKGSVVKSVRGPGGGYVLARSMDEISVKDVLISVGENINPARDLVGSGDTKSDTVEFILTKTYFENLGLIMQEYLTTTSVGDLIRKARGTQDLPKGAAGARLGGFQMRCPGECRQGPGPRSILMRMPARLCDPKSRRRSAAVLVGMSECDLTQGRR